MLIYFIINWIFGKKLLYYQINLFWQKKKKKKRKLKNEHIYLSTITKLGIVDQYRGEEFLTWEESKKLENQVTFNRSSLFFEQRQRAILTHDIIKMQKWKTISHAPQNLDFIMPFKHQFTFQQSK